MVKRTHPSQQIILFGSKGTCLLGTDSRRIKQSNNDSHIFFLLMFIISYCSASINMYCQWKVPVKAWAQIKLIWLMFIASKHCLETTFSRILVKKETRTVSMKSHKQRVTGECDWNNDTGTSIKDLYIKNLHKSHGIKVLYMTWLSLKIF